MTKGEFELILEDLADCWRREDYRAAMEHFALDVCYGDPVRYSLNGQDELRNFFENDDGLPQLTTWHAILFDEEKQMGAAEYSYTGTHSYHGIVLVKIKDNKILRWREYQHIDPRAWDEFVATTSFD